MPLTMEMRNIGFSIMKPFTSLAIVLLFSLTLAAQPPSIATGGVVNSARLRQGRQRLWIGNRAWFSGEHLWVVSRRSDGGRRFSAVFDVTRKCERDFQRCPGAGGFRRAKRPLPFCYRAGAF